ncbi:RNA exonuclease 1 homolog isoform X2 [Pristis pectinata]|uniref:RNA exonuclease 1 homolog isoform X2 n=1 Tax=Pristis pectinata TaxID=685728 RepID=UPI00223E55AC|nr:RNA exonuclease 1 homolog isoform X2 [Pristis pectinata]
MLSSSGCFRRFPCPFLSRCQRVYCHFKHAGRLSTPQGAPANILGKYHDRPVSPEAAYTVLELEKVTKAIEVIKTEVEQQQHKLLMCQSSCDCKNNSSVIPINSKTSSPFSSAGRTSIKHKSSSLSECNYVLYNPTPRSNYSSCKHIFNASGEEDTSQDIAMANSNIKTACSVWSKYMIEHCRPSTDLEYDPLVNYSSSLKQICSKERMEEKQGSKGAIDQEMKHSFASETVRNFQPFEAEMSSEDELVIDVPDLPPLAPHPRAHGELQRKGNDNLTLVRKVKQPNVEESVGVVLALEKTVNSFSDLGSENDGRETELNLDALQRTQIPHPAECNEASTLTSDQMRKAGCHHKDIKLGFKAKRRGEALNLGLVQLENAVAPINKCPTYNCGQEFGPEKLDVQKCGKVKEQSSIHLNASTLSNCTGQLSEFGSSSLKTGQMTSTAVRCNRLETTNTSCTSKLGESLTVGQAGMKTPNPVSDFGNRNWDGSLQTASDKGEESSSSGEELNSTASEDLEFSDSDPMEECLRIFNEFSKQETKANETVIEQNSVTNIQEPVNAANAQTRQKKRIAHVAKFKGTSSSNRVIIPHTPPVPKLRCHSRIKLVQQQAVQLTANVKGGQAYKATVSDCLAQKKLLVQSSKLQAASTVKKVFRDSFKKIPGASRSSRGAGPLTGKVLCSTSKANHDTSLLGPGAPVPVMQRTPSKQRSKVSNNIRKQYLGFFIEEFLKTSSSRQEAVNKATSEERTIFEHSTSRFMYLNVAVHTLKVLRNPANHEPPLSNGQHSVKRNRPSSGTTLEGAALYRALKGYVLSEEQLKDGYLHSSPDKPGTAVLFNGEAKKCIVNSLIQVCCRCGLSFSVTPEGNYISKEECVHHWGRLIRRQGSDAWECRYNCCEGLLESVGCQVAKLHVYNRKENLDGFVKTHLKLLPLDGNPGIYAINSEVCYTKQGAELARVSVVNANLEVVYDEFVKPENEVIDYNTGFSGVSQEDLINAKTTLSDVQTALLRILSADAILIGHSLDKDLLAVKDLDLLRKGVPAWSSCCGK